MNQFEISRLAMGALHPMGGEVVQETKEIVNVMQDYEFALGILLQGHNKEVADRDVYETALKCAKLAQDERRKPSFWRRIF